MIKIRKKRENCPINWGVQIFSPIIYARKLIKSKKMIDLSQIEIQKHLLEEHVQKKENIKILPNMVLEMDKFYKEFKKREKHSGKTKIFFDKELILKILNENEYYCPSLKEIKQEYQKIRKNHKFSITSLRRYLRNTLKLRFKKAILINSRLKREEYTLCYKIYIRKLLLIMKQKHLIIFIDECSFGEKSLTKKIWCNDRINNFKYNYGRIGSVSIMGAITNNKILHLSFNKGINYAIDYYGFLEDLKKKIKDDPVTKKLYNNNQITIILDNARIHTAKSIRTDIKDFKFNYLYMVPYSPMLNPIELLWSHFKRIRSKTIFKNM